MTIEVLAGFAIASLMFSTISGALVIWCTTELKAMQKSTHQVQFIPADERIEKTDPLGFEVLDEKSRQKLEDEQDLFEYN